MLLHVQPECRKCLLNAILIADRLVVTLSVKHFAFYAILSLMFNIHLSGICMNMSKVIR